METDFKQKLGQTIALRRRECGLSKQRFALMIGISRVTLRRIEDGTGNPTIDILLKICEGLDTTFPTMVERAMGTKAKTEYRHIDF